MRSLRHRLAARKRPSSGTTERRPFRITRRMVKTFLIAFALFMFVGTGIASAVDGKPSDTAGFGAILNLPDLTGGGGKTLFESIAPGAFFLDTELDYSNPVENFMAGINDLIMALLSIIAYSAIGLTYWLFSLTSVDSLSNTAGEMIGVTGTALMTWLAPSALAFGAVIAYAQNKKDGTSFSQISWMVLAGFLGISFVVAPNMWVQGVDQVRTGGADVIISTTATGIQLNREEPFEWAEVQFTGSDRNNLLRKSGDSVWRTLVVTPWCVAEYGSMEACKAYAKPMLAKGMDREARKDYIKNTIYSAQGEGSKEAPVSQWVKGQQWYQRLPIVLLALVNAIVFCGLMVTLGLAALAAVISAYFLLIVGAYFALTWIIPGKFRQAGLGWFNALLGTVIASLMATMVFGAVLVLETAVFSGIASFGWGPTIILSLVVMVVAFGFRRTLMNVMSVADPRNGGMGALGYLAMRGVSKMLAGGGAGRKAAVKPRPTLQSKPQMGGGLQDLGERSRAARPAARQFRQLNSGPAPTARFALPEGGAPAPRPMGALPAGRATPAGARSRGPRVENAKFEMPKGSSGAYPVPHSEPGRRTERLRPRATERPQAQRPTPQRPARVRTDLPAGPPTRSSATKAPQSQQGKTPQFKSFKNTQTIKGEVVNDRPGRPRPQRR
jgi:hypothetical protein